MRLVPLLVVLSVCGLALAEEKKTAASNDASELQGTWKMTDSRGFKADTSADELNNLRLVIKDHDLTACYGDKVVKASFMVNSTAVPAQIDVTITDGPAEVKGKTFQGIYLVEGKVLHVEFRKPGQPRPSDISTRNTKDLYELWFKKAEK